MVVMRRGCRKTVCARGAWPAWVPGPSTSSLERTMAGVLSFSVARSALTCLSKSILVC